MPNIIDGRPNWRNPVGDGGGNRRNAQGAVGSSLVRGGANSNTRTTALSYINRGKGRTGSMLTRNDDRNLATGSNIKRR